MNYFNILRNTLQHSTVGTTDFLGYNRCPKERFHKFIETKRFILHLDFDGFKKTNFTKRKPHFFNYFTIKQCQLIGTC